MFSFSIKSRIILKTRKYLLLTIGTIFLSSMCNLCGCGSGIDISERNAIIVADKNEDIFPGYFESKLALKTEKISFTEENKFLNKIFSFKTDSLSEIFEKAFDISEKIRNRNNIELKNYYLLPDKLILVKSAFSDIKNKFEVIETSYDATIKIKDNAFNEMIGKIAYLKNYQIGNNRIMSEKGQNLTPVFTKKQDDNRSQIFNPKGRVMIELSRIWPFKTSADNQ